MNVITHGYAHRMRQLSDERYRQALRDETARLAAAVAGADPDAPVPACPEWPLRGLVEHVGRAHRWAAAVTGHGYLPLAETPGGTPPDTVGDWPRWLGEGADLVVAAVDGAGPDTPVWTPLGPLPARFWLRRSTHDTAVHRVDAERAAGAAPRGIDPDVAADGFTEGLELVTLPAARRARPALAELRGTGQTLHFHATDAELAGAGEWLVERAPDGLRWRPGHARSDVAVRGTASDLLLLGLRRIPVTAPGLAVRGDRRLLAEYLERTAF
jgi:uncharacterized protein (TIGR03083 family)